MPLISFEGIDNCGKSTQIRKIFDYLGKEKKHEAILTREPGATFAGAIIRDLLLNPQYKLNDRTEILLFMANRAQHFHEIIKPNLEENKFVLSDRCVDSTYAYQIYGRKTQVDVVHEMMKFCTWNIKPDFTVLLDLDPQVAFERKFSSEYKQGKDRMELECLEFHEKVRKGFLEIYEKEKERFLLIDAAKEEEEITLIVKEEIDKRFNL